MINNRINFSLIFSVLLFCTHIAQAQKIAVPISSYGVWDRGGGVDDYSDPKADFVMGIEVSATWAEVQSMGASKFDFSMFQKVLDKAAKHHKIVKISINVGPNSPLWLYDNGVPLVKVKSHKPEKHDKKFGNYPYYLNENHKKYYFMVLSYGYNNYQTYDPSNSSAGGQQLPYKAGRKTVTGGAITSYVGIPHIPSSESGGTIQIASYGSGPKITRVEGRGNGSNLVELTAKSEEDIVKNIYPKRVTYKNGKGPVNVKIIDPLNVQQGDYKLWINKGDTLDLKDSYWVLERTTSNGQLETVESSQSIANGNEQLIPQWGLSVNIEYYDSYDPTISKNFPELLFSSVEFEDSSKQWLSGIPDEDGSSPTNWIRSGTSEEEQDFVAYASKCEDPFIYNDELGADDNQVYEKVVEGVWSPYRLVAAGDCNHQPVTSGGDWADNAYEQPVVAPNVNAQMSLATTRIQSDLKYLSSIDVVITADKSKWTRCPVLETQDNPSWSWDQSGAINQSMSNKYGNGTSVARVYKQYPKWKPSRIKRGNREVIIEARTRTNL